MNLKLKKENDDLRKRLAKLEQSLACLNQEKREADDLLHHVLASETPAATNMEAAGSSWNPRGPGKHRPSKKRHPKRSPVHKRVKIPVMTGADFINERFSIAAVDQEQADEQRKMEEIERRLSIRLTAQLQHMNEHG